MKKFRPRSQGWLYGGWKNEDIRNPEINDISRPVLSVGVSDAFSKEEKRQKTWPKVLVLDVLLRPITKDKSLPSIRLIAQGKALMPGSFPEENIIQGVEILWSGKGDSRLYDGDDFQDMSPDLIRSLGLYSGKVLGKKQYAVFTGAEGMKEKVPDTVDIRADCYDDGTLDWSVGEKTYRGCKALLLPCGALFSGGKKWQDSEQTYAQVTQKYENTDMILYTVSSLKDLGIDPGETSRSLENSFAFYPGKEKPLTLLRWLRSGGLEIKTEALETEYSEVYTSCDVIEPLSLQDLAKVILRRR